MSFKVQLKEQGEHLIAWIILFLTPLVALIFYIINIISKISIKKSNRKKRLLHSQEVVL